MRSTVQSTPDRGRASTLSVPPTTASRAALVHQVRTHLVVSKLRAAHQAAHPPAATSIGPGRSLLPPAGVAVRGCPRGDRFLYGRRSIRCRFDFSVQPTHETGSRSCAQVRIRWPAASTTTWCAHTTLRSMDSGHCRRATVCAQTNGSLPTSSSCHSTPRGQAKPPRDRCGLEQSEAALLAPSGVRPLIPVGEQRSVSSGTLEESSTVDSHPMHRRADRSANRSCQPLIAADGEPALTRVVTFLRGPFAHRQIVSSTSQNLEPRAETF